MGYAPTRNFILLLIIFIAVLSVYYWQIVRIRTTDDNLNVTSIHILNTSSQKQSNTVELMNDKTTLVNGSDELNTVAYKDITKMIPKERLTSPRTPLLQGVSELLSGSQHGKIDNGRTSLLHQDVRNEIITTERTLYTRKPVFKGFPGLSRKTHREKITPGRSFLSHQNVEEESCSSHFKDNHIIAMEKPLGRTGNLLFELLVLFSVAKTMCYTPVLHPAFRLLLENVIDMSDFHFMNISSIENKQICHEEDDGTIVTDIMSLDKSFNWTLDGYFQSWKYFTNYEHYLRGEIKLTKHNVFLAHILFKILNDTENVKITAVHVRRGDFLINEHLGFKAASRGYIERALTLVNEKFANYTLKFVFVSDDIPWCKYNFKKNGTFYFSEFDSIGTDLAIISLSDHVIITSGSFGWIGAWLSGKHVIYYKGYPIPNTWLGKRLQHSEYYPPEWTGIY